LSAGRDSVAFPLPRRTSMVRRSLRLLIHPATILALTALFVGAAGGAFATTSGLIGSPQIKDDSIKLIDLSPQAVRGLRGRVGPQ
jgi:hypothetical protein